MSKRKHYVIVSSSEDEDEEIQQPRPKKPFTGFPYGGEDGFTYHPSPYIPGIRTDTGTQQACKQPDSPITISDSDDDDDILDNELSDYEEDGQLGEKCNIRGCFLQDITLPTSIYVTNFQATKQELVTRLYQLYNTTIFENKLPENMSIVWNKRLTATSAYCLSNREGDNRHCVINLSEKVCDSAERLRDTLVHEMCHAACWLIDKSNNGHHGPLWKAHAAKVTNIHPELPKVEVYHNYQIHYPFTYQCSVCQCSFGRYRKITDKNIYCNLCQKG